MLPAPRDEMLAQVLTHHLRLPAVHLWEGTHLPAGSRRDSEDSIENIGKSGLRDVPTRLGFSND
ncbi:hypothetical protein FRC08_010364 [Ceratobasidium sp. 394]|nr:hypothetical protein FRC08_010364 [Ceratobasidium sp. 394]